jgi:hypothetical protein
LFFGLNPENGFFTEKPELTKNYCLNQVKKAQGKLIPYNPPKEISNNMDLTDSFM